VYGEQYPSWNEYGVSSGRRPGMATTAGRRTAAACRQTIKVENSGSPTGTPELFLA
jgi:hypothetical protein